MSTEKNPEEEKHPEVADIEAQAEVRALALQAQFKARAQEAIVSAPKPQATE